MAPDHRMLANGERLDHTCENAKFLTNIRLGEPHVEGQQHRGSVFREPLYADGEWSLWLEHVTRKENPSEPYYWLMWYRNGVPTIPLSGVLQRDDIANMSRLLASFVP